MVDSRTTAEDPGDRVGLGWPRTADLDVPREIFADVTPAGLGWPKTPLPQGELASKESAS